MKIEIKNRGRKLKLEVERVGTFGMIKGLMFSHRRNLLFDFSKDSEMGIHSYFVFFPFIAIWLDARNKVLEWRIVKPFEAYVYPSRSYRKLVEIPVRGNEKVFRFLVGKISRR